jgi:hypothetical protein
MILYQYFNLIGFLVSHVARLFALLSLAARLFWQEGPV